MKRLFDYPFQVGVPQRQLVNNVKELVALIKKYNGIKPLYNCIYNEQRILTKIFFDFDTTHAIDDVKSLDDWCEKRNILRVILFSGMKGFHFYIFTKDYDNIFLVKDCLYNAHTYIINEIRKENTEFEPDQQIIGNIAQSGRIPNTYHTVGNAYCIPITREDLDLGIDHIRSLSKKQRFGDFFKGEELLDIKQFDKKSKRRRATESGEMDNYDYDLSVDDAMVQKFPPCVQKWLLEPKEYCKNRTRYYFALFCKGLALPPSVCDQIAKKYWTGVKESSGSRSKYHEFVQEQQIKHAYSKDNTLPNCVTLYDLGFCPGKCKQFKENNFPIYLD